MIEATKQGGVGALSPAGGISGFVSAILLWALRFVATRRVMSGIAVAVFSAIVLGTVSLAYFNPYYNWDMAAYVAVAIEEPAQGAEDLHVAAWGEVRETASDKQFFNLTRSSEYRIGLYENPEHFVSLLPMFAVKFGYVETIKALGGFVGPVQATIVISTVAAVLVGLMIMAWSFKHDFVQGLLIAGPAILLAGYLYSAREATPDLYMAVFSVAGIYFASKGRPLAAAPFLLAMFMIRPDGILFLFALLLSSVVVGRDRIAYLLVFAAALALYFPISSGAGHPGWWPHFYFTNVEYQSDMRGFAPDFSAVLYLKALVVNGIRALQWFNWPMLLGLFVIGFWLLHLGGKRIERSQALVLIGIILCAGGKFITFPMPDDRGYLPFMIPFVLVLLDIWKPDFSLPSGRRTEAVAAPAS